MPQPFRIKRVPLRIVPRAMAAALAAITHRGMWKDEITPADSSPIVITPMTFCPSFEPVTEAHPNKCQNWIF